MRPPKKWLNDSEEEILRKLMQGDQLTLDEHVYMISDLISTPIARTKGFILDLDLNAGWKTSWLERIYEQSILGKQDFTHVVELEMEDDEVKRRAIGLRQDLSTGVVYSEWERIELAKPKKYFDEDGEEIEIDEDDERYVKPLDSDNLITRVCDERVVTELDLYFNYERNLAAVNDLIGRMWNHTYIKIEAAGLTPDELAENATFRLKPSQDEPLRPIAHIIEGGAGDYK